MSAFALLLVCAAVAYGVSTWAKVPAPPLLVAAGIGLNASGLLGSTDFVNFVLLMGVTVLVFVAGAELNPARFARQGVVAFKVGISQFLALGAMGFGIAYWLGFDPLGSAYVALALAASSTFIVVRILKQRRQFYEPFGRMVLGVLLIQDVLVVLALGALMRWPEGQLAVESALFRSMALLVVAWVSARTLVPWLLTKLRLDEEAQLIVVMAILFIFIGGSHFLDVPLVTGAFCAGFAVSPFPVNAVIRGQLTSMSDFFIALFFTALGAMLVIPTLKTVLVAGLMALGVMITTPLLVTWFAERSGMTARSSIESGLLLAQTSEFSLVVALLGAGQDMLDSELLAAITLATVVTMVLTQFLATEKNVWRLLKVHPSTLRRQIDQLDVEDHVVVLGVGRNAETLVRRLLDEDHVVVVVDHDPVVCEWAEKSGARVTKADASDPRILKEIRAHHAKLVVSTLKQVSDNCRIVRELSGIPTLVRVFEDAEAEMIEQAGGIPVPYAEAAASEFLDWYSKYKGPERAPHPDASEAA